MLTGALTRVVGLVRWPRRTLGDVVAAPRWAGVLAAATIAACAANALLLNTAIGRQALVDQWERMSLAVGVDVDDAVYVRLQGWSELGAAYGALIALVSVAGVVAAASGTVYLAYGRRDAARVPFKAVLAVVAHTGVILALRVIVAAPIAYARESTASATSVGTWLGGFDESSPVARFLTLLDAFALWWIVVLAIGVSVLYRQRAARLAATFLGLYVGVAAAVAGVIAAIGTT